MDKSIVEINELLKVCSPFFSQLPVDLKVGFVRCESGYSVEKEGDNATVHYSSQSTLYRSITLLAATVSEQSVSISNLEKVGEFGVMVDCSRNAVPRIDFLKEFALNIAHLGYNALYLYTEDTYRLQDEPYFGHLRGGYTVEDLAELCSYCLDIGIELIPCIQTLAHLSQIFRWPDYQAINDCTDILLIGEEKTYALIEKMAKFCRAAFKTNKVNIGLDEAHFIGLGKYLSINGYTDRIELMKEHISRVSKIFTKYGFTKILMWSDMFLRLVSGGEYYDDKSTIPNNLDNAVPENVSLVYWDYYTLDKERYLKMMQKHKKMSKNIYFASGAWKWGGFAPSNIHSIKSGRLGIESAKQMGINDIFVTAWGDNGADCSLMAVMPSLIDAANVYYQTDEKYAEEMCKALTGVSFDNYLSLDRANCLSPDFNTGILTSNTKFLLYNDLLQGLFDITVKETYAQQYLNNSNELRKYTKTKYGYVFETLADLTKLLSVKATLGLRITDNYKAGNKSGLKKNIAEIRLCINLTKKFYSAFKKQWLTENRPFGLEIQEVRIGGLLFRMEQNIETLQSYLSGKISSIPELEEVRLNPCIKSGQDNKFAQDIMFNNFAWNTSTNVL